MRLTVRRKLIATLMLVGLLPMVVAMPAIVGIGASLRLEYVRSNCLNLAQTSAHAVSLQIGSEIKRVALLAQLPVVIDFATSKNAGSSGINTPSNASPEFVNAIVDNSLADSLRLSGRIGPPYARFLITDRWGNVISSDIVPGAWNQSGLEWWHRAFRDNQPHGFVGILNNNLTIAAPMLQKSDGRFLGYVLETSGTDQLEAELSRGSTAERLTAEIYDRQLNIPVLVNGGVTLPQTHSQTQSVNQSFTWWHDLVEGTISSSAPVNFMDLNRVMAAPIIFPEWTVIFEEPSLRAIEPVFQYAQTFGIAGLLLIAGFLLLGLFISQHEIIRPIMRLRHAASAVGRGELNVRLLSGSGRDATFRQDEIGDLAADFDAMTRQLQRNIDQISSNNKARQRFMEIAGHELRTPTTHIILKTDLLQRQLAQAGIVRPQASRVDQPGDPLVQVFGSIDDINAAGRRMAKIIDNLLKLIESNKFISTFQRRLFDIRSLILHVCEQHLGFINARNQKLIVNVPETLPQMDGDPDKIHDVLANVISNAIRFSPDGAEIRVSAQLLIGDVLEIVVEDTGVGMPQQVMEKLFEPFQTGGESLQHRSGTFEYQSQGLGVGLAIVRRFVELHGGLIRVHSLERGTKVQILLPLTEDVIVSNAFLSQQPDAGPESP
ncbi:MAG TPA: HAMP domain-containing sensor histidine kinase [Phycisphaerae bacterium]|nr:HAMP domain-containing sensor histidine kinase [Phycisphaerae bacterium]